MLSRLRFNSPLLKWSDLSTLPFKNQKKDVRIHRVGWVMYRISFYWFWSPTDSIRSASFMAKEQGRESWCLELCPFPCCTFAVYGYKTEFGYQGNSMAVLHSLLLLTISSMMVNGHGARQSKPGTQSVEPQK